MTPFHALQVALRNETRGHDFYAQIAAGSGNPEVRRLAGAFASEEATHVEELKKWFARFPAPGAGWDEDADPPNASE